jgi:hypothetical protein
VVLSALPISVFVSDGAGWVNVGAGNVSDGLGGYDVAAIVCHFSLYTAFGPAPLAPPPSDTDGDVVPDATDNCPTIANGPGEAGIPGVGNQTNTDGSNAALNRAGQDRLGDACDDNISGDGYTNAQHTALGKDPLLYCAIMRADVDGDGVVSILDLSRDAQKFGQAVPPAAERLGQDGDNAITILDLSKMAGKFGQPVTLCP